MALAAFQELMNAMTSWTGIALFGIGFLAGIAPTLTQILQRTQAQQDLSASMSQLIQAMIPLMMFMMMMQMFMGMFRAPVMAGRYY